MILTKNALQRKPLGFTLLELVVVLAGLGILASLATPNLLKYLQHARNDEASSFLNAISSECLQNYRIDKTSIDKTIKSLDRSGAPRDFKVEPESDKCSMTLISPANKSDTVLASFGFMTKLRNGVPYIYKFGSYAHPDAEQACLNWASYKVDNAGNTILPKARACDEGGDVKEIRARIAAEAAERERLRLIQARYDTWIAGPPPGTGNYTADGKNIWAFQGNVVADKAAFDKAVERECGRELVDALNKAKSDKHDGPYNYTGKSGGCSISTHLCSGTDVGSKDGYDACKRAETVTACNAELSRRTTSPFIDGHFTNLPDGRGCPGVYTCKGTEHSTQEEYNRDKRCNPPQPPPPPPPQACIFPRAWGLCP